MREREGISKEGKDDRMDAVDRDALTRRLDRHDVRGRSVGDITGYLRVWHPPLLLATRQAT